VAVLRKKEILGLQALDRGVQRVVIEQDRAQDASSASILCGRGRSRVVSLAMIRFIFAYIDFSRKSQFAAPARASFFSIGVGSEPELA